MYFYDYKPRQSSRDINFFDIIYNDRFYLINKLRLRWDYDDRKSRREN